MAKCSKNKRRRRWLKLAIVLCVLAGFCAWYYFALISPIMETVVTERVRMQVSKAIDDMTDGELQAVRYDDFVITRYDDEGQVTLMQINSVNVDLFARKVTARIRTEMEAFESAPIAIRLGTLSGIPLFSGMGPEIEFRPLNLGIVDADFSSEFLSGGINQTLHRLYMRIVVNMTITLPGRIFDFENGSNVMICESLIAGDIPFASVNLGDFTGKDLLP